MSDRGDDDTRDEEAPSDDAVTPREPRFERARSQSGEIDVPELPSRRARTQPAIESPRPPRYRQSHDARALDGFRSKDTGPLPVVVDDGVPEPSGPENAITPPPTDVRADPVALKTWNHVNAMGERVANLVASLEHSVSQLGAGGVVHRDVKPEKSAPLKQWLRRDLIAPLLVLAIAGAVGTMLARAFSEHDQIIVIEERLTTLERTLGAVVVPRISPSLLNPGASPGKDPTP